MLEEIKTTKNLIADMFINSKPSHSNDTQSIEDISMK